MHMPAGFLTSHLEGLDTTRGYTVYIRKTTSDKLKRFHHYGTGRKSCSGEGQNKHMPKYYVPSFKFSQIAVFDISCDLMHCKQYTRLAVL